jgi:hypothetical protein
LPGYLYGVSKEAIWVHQYVAGRARFPLDGGRVIALVQETRYPWDGEIAIAIDGEGDLSLLLRIPRWCEQGATLTVNGESPLESLVPGSYVEVNRTWRTGDIVRLTLPMPVRRVKSHPYVEENAGRVALMRGPLLYSVEQADNPGLAIRDIELPVDAAFDPEYRPDLLGGVVVLTVEGRAGSPDDSWAHTLYRTAHGDGTTPGAKRVTMTAIPYHAWANREPGPMRVWLRRCS